MSAVGAVLGGVLGVGLWCFVDTATRRRATLAGRVAPYLVTTPAQSKLLSTRTHVPAVQLWLGRAAGARVMGIIDRWGTSRAVVQRRLDELGSTTSVDHFRMQQVICGAVALAVTLVVGVPIAMRRGDVIPALALVVIGVFLAVAAWDQRLARACQAQRRAIEEQLAPVADLLALGVAAGLSPRDALERVTVLIGGQLPAQLRATLDAVRAGAPLGAALDAMAGRCHVVALSRLVDALVAAMERGTPLAGVLKAQAADVRDASRQRLLREAGRREIAMLVPVVFIIMPVAVLFALFPGLIALNLTG